MRQRKNELTAERGLELLERHWKWVVVAFWLLFCAWFIVNRSNAIRFFSLGDTDDNMRMMQVRGLLHGQGWFDLANSIGSPGANIHWSRLVDLPIAGLILVLRPLLGGAAAERWAVGIAPMLPYLLLLFSVALTVRRLVDPPRFPARLPRSVLRRIDQRHVHARADRPSRLAARFGRACDIGDRRPQSRARRDRARGRHRAVTGDRARDADLSGARGGGDGAVLGRRPRRARAARRPMRSRSAEARRSHS